MGEGGALRGSGGARGVLDVDRVVERQRRFAGRQRGVIDEGGLREQRLPLFVDDQGFLELAAVPAHLVEEIGVAGLTKTPREEQQARARLVQRMGQLARLVGGVDVHQHGTDAGRCILGDDPLVAVRRPDRHAVALLDVPAHEGLGELRGEVPELLVSRSEVLRADDQSLVRRYARDGTMEVVPDGLAEQRDVTRALRVRRTVDSIHHQGGH